MKILLRQTLLVLSVLLCFSDVDAQVVATIGAGTGSNTTTSYPAPFGNYWWGARQQQLYTATELSAAGIPSGAIITSMGFNATALNTNPPLVNFEMKVGNSPVANMNAWVPGLTSYYTNTAYSPTLGWNNLNFTVPFIWNGTDNIVVETCFNNTSFLNNVSTQWTTGLSFNAARLYRQDAGGVCANNGQTSTFTTRTNLRIIYTPPTPCTGVPNHDTVVGNMNPCPGVQTCYSLTGNNPFSGMARQWYSGPSAVGPWTPTSPADTNGAVCLTPPVPGPTWYTCITTCISSGQSDTATAIMVTPATFSPFSPCYCGNSNATITTLGDIGQFTVGTLINPATPPPSINNPNSVNGYSNFDTLTPIPTFIQGQTYPISMLPTFSSSATYAGWVKAWIDYNHNTSWTDPGEEVFNTATNGINLASGTFTVATTALPGLTRLRCVYNMLGNQAATQPCGTYNYGETEDYVVNILAAGPYDPAVTGIQVIPAGGCMDSCETVIATITNFGSQNLDLSLNPIVLRLNVSGPNGTTVYTDTINNGILQPFSTNNTFNIYPCVNLFEGGCYSINTDTITLLGANNTNLINDSLFAPVVVCNSRPNAIDYTLCINDTIPTGNGLAIANCPTGLVQDSVIIPFTLYTSTNALANPSQCAAQGAGDFAFGTLPNLPTGANILGGEISASNLALAGLVFTTNPSLTRISLHQGTPPAAVGNVVHNGLSGSALTGNPGTFSYSSSPPAVDLNTLYTNGVPNNTSVFMGHWSTNRCTAPNIQVNSGGPSTVYLKIVYEYVPMGISWYEVPSGGVAISNASTLDPLTTPNSIVSNSSTINTYTFYGACAADTNCRVPVDLIVTGLTYASVVDTAVLCNGDTTGSIAATMSGGVTPYTYTLTGSANTYTNTTGYFPNLGADVYTLNVTDAVGCSSGDSTITITEPQPLVIDSITSTSPSCTPGGDATMTVFVSGGTTPYTDYNNGITNQSGNVFSNQSAQLYNVIVTDTNGCTAQTSHTIVAPTPPTWNSISLTDVSCFGDTSGTIVASATPGSSGIATYATITPNTQGPVGTFTGVGAGQYTVRATDSNNCFIDTVVDILSPTQLAFATGSTDSVSCNGGTDGKIFVTGTGGTPGTPPTYLYAITAPATAVTPPSPIDSFVNLAAGTYTIQLTDSNGCDHDTMMVVGAPNSLAIDTVSTQAVQCNGDSTGIITMSNTGGTGTVTYTVIPYGTVVGNVISNLGANTFTVTGTDANGCTSVSMITISEPTAVQITNITSTIPSCVPGCDATVTITANGGVGPLIYPPLTNQCAGTAVYTVTDQNGCIDTMSHTISTPGSPVWGTITTDTVSCFGLSDGGFTANVTQGTGAIDSIIITATNTALPVPQLLSTGSSVGNASSLAAGSYTVRAVDVNGCAIITTINVFEPALLTIDSVVVDSVNCNGDADGSITVFVSGGTTNYSYQLGSNTPQPSNVFNNLAQGPYTITVTDANTCVATTSVTVNQPGPLSYTSVVVNNVSCNGAGDGQIVAAGAGGTAPLTFGLPTPPQASGTFSNLGGGSQTVRITDGNGCTLDSTVNIIEPAVLSIDTASTTQVLCFGDSTGQIVMTRTGGTPSVAYSVVPNIGTQSPVGDSTINNLPAGTYTITGTDANGCTAVSTVTITAPLSPVDITAISGTTPSCSPGMDGTITVTASGGVPPLQYGLLPIPPNTYQASNIISSLSSGGYSVRVRDANGCFADTVYTITNASAPTIDSITTVMTQCNGDSTGSLMAYGTSSQQATVTFQIISPFVTPATPQASGLFTGLPAGFYTVEMNDVNNCPVQSTVQIMEPTAVAFTNVTIDSVNCFGGSDGIITLTATGGTAPYSTTTASVGPSPTFVFNNRSAQPYTLQLVDDNGCTADSTIVVSQPSAVTVDTVLATDILCNGDSTGSITVLASGGTGNIGYSINPAATQAPVGTFTNLAATNYTVTATDANNCIATSAVSLSEPTPLTQTFTTQNVTCFGGNDGEIVLSGNGGVGPYNFALIPTSPILSNMDTFSNLMAGTNYQGVLQDANGCLDTSVQITITEPTQMVFTNVTSQDIECFGASTGSISVASNQGTGPHTYTISPDPNGVGTVGPSPQTFGNLPAGAYTIVASDQNNCTIVTQVTITENPQIFFSSITNTEEICFGDGKASITFQASGGVGGFVYSFDGSMPPTTQTTYTSLTTGTYTIQAIDSLGCTNDTSYTLTGPDPITFTEFIVTPTTCLDTEDGKLSVTATGGRGSFYDYVLEPGTRINTNGIFRDLPPGQYILTVTDTAECTVDTIVNIELPSNPMVVSITKEDLGCHGRGNEGKATANVTGGTQPYTYLWSTTPVQTAPVAIGLYQGAYTVDVVDAQGCLERDTLVIEPGPCCQEVFLPTAFSPNGDGRNDEFRILSSAGIELTQFEVYNRWGVRVWQTNNVRQSWDGTYGGEPVDVGTFHYVMRYRCLTDGQNYIKKGDVTVVR